MTIVSGEQIYTTFQGKTQQRDRGISDTDRYIKNRVWIKNLQLVRTILGCHLNAGGTSGILGARMPVNKALKLVGKSMSTREIPTSVVLNVRT